MSLQKGTSEPTQCPNGTFRAQPLAQSVADCLYCTPGFFCNTTALVAPVGSCSAGHFCPTGSVSPTQYKCPEGHYCPLGTEHPKECPAGTFSNASRLEKEQDCPKCLPGQFCATKKLTYPTGPCKAGYYCPLGSASDTQVTCPSAMQCPEGSATPQHCPEGSFTESGLSSSCELCPPGYYCIPHTVTPGKLKLILFRVGFL